MKQEALRKWMNLVIPVIGIGLLIFYEVCDTSCSSLRGTLLGIDLKIVGVLFMAVFLGTLPGGSRPALARQMEHLRTMMLSGAMGGEVLLVRFQIVNDTYCPFCLAFGLCLLTLFAANFPRMNRYLAAAAFVAGIGAFGLFFRGSVLPLYY
ncbi:MAG TPA: hypothetical protein PK175_09250 [Syntrophales bacterium]|nr:hypothetical protein [Syntrophales bacterium]HOU78354.1 hypothetical protein [Syntrophales bacterium]HQG35045.1 hypothetical protein [Syntrophales bacterium]HQI36366.1 hypothetical protein [Syntrophales bacterium]HQJ30929.1 hypothetical protein [Syntrophales bacterium]